MTSHYENSMYSRDELLKKRENATRTLAANKELSIEQKQSLLKLIKYIDTQLASNVGSSSNLSRPTTKTGKQDTVRIAFLVFAIVFYLISAIMGYKGYDKMTNYYHSEKYSSLDVNAYVGGDAYNYIINGNYATGFFVLSTGFMIAGTIFLSSYLLAEIIVIREE